MSDPKNRFASGLELLLRFALIAGLTGAGASLFLNGLELITLTRESSPLLFLLAPVVGALTGFWFYVWAPRAAPGTALVASLLRHGDAPQLPPPSRLERVPKSLAPLIVVSTWLAHLAGLSVGREGTAVQMGAGIAAGLRPPKSPLSRRMESYYLLAGVAAGFGAVFGVPLAGAVFALELGKNLERPRLRQWRDRLRESAVALAASFAADQVARALRARHTLYPAAPPLTSWLSVRAVGGLLTASVVFAVLAWCFLFLLHKFKVLWARLVGRAVWRPVVGGLLYAPMCWATPEWKKFAGLGVSGIVRSFDTVATFSDPIFKILFTVFAIGVGFRGGEVTPLFFVGAGAGSAVAGLWGLEPAALAALGLVAVFAAAAEVPWACAVMAAELFGPAIFLPALLSCWIASSLCRHARLYDTKGEI